MASPAAATEAGETLDTAQPDERSTRRGRPLSVERSDQILTAVFELLGEIGFDQLRMHDVAERAGVGLATIYRRWPTKLDLVRASLESAEFPFALNYTDDPHADVEAILRRVADDCNARGPEGLFGFMSCVRLDPQTADVFRCAMTHKLNSYLRDRLAAGLGADHPELEMRALAGPAILLYKAAICGQRLDSDAAAKELTDLLFSSASSAGSRTPR